ncbi:MAG: GNAT family N-acetyltransferase [Candidatus Saccharibacteria bacterium]
MTNYEKYKQLLLRNNYKLDDTHAYMVYSRRSEVNIHVTEKVIRVKNKDQYNDYMEVLSSAFGGEISADNPYAGSINDEYYQAIKDSLNNNDIYHYVLYKDDEPACVATLSTANKTGSINNVGTLKGYQNKGLGKQIMSYMISEFEKLGGKELFLFTEHNSKNEQWYERQSFKTIAIIEQYVKE